MMKMTALTVTALVLLTAGAPAAQAADGDNPVADVPHVEIAESPRIQMVPPVENAQRVQLQGVQLTRPASLPVMYVALAGLQAYDGYSTLHGTSTGASETNPLVSGLAAHPAAFWSLKAASTVATIFFAEQLWRQNHRKQAVLLMVVANGAMGVVAARNASVLSRR